MLRSGRNAACVMVLLVSRPLRAAAADVAPAQPVIGVTMAHFDDNWLTILRTAMAEHAATFPGVALQFSDAQGDVAGSSARSRTSWHRAPRRSS